jgi:2-iminobutanoate/2-iminopropanoate deaminase
MREVIATHNAPQAIGPYSQAIRANGFIFVSGQAGSGLDKVVRTGVYLKDMGEFAAMNDVYERFFPQNAPARSTVEVARLPKDVRVEIDVIALAE